MSREKERQFKKMSQNIMEYRKKVENMLYHDTDDVIKRYFEYDKFNKIFILDPNAADDIEKLILPDYQSNFSSYVSIVRRKYYNEFNTKEFLKLLKDEDEDFTFNFRRLLSCLVLEGHYGIDKKEINHYVPRSAKPESISEFTLNIILNLTKEENEKAIIHRNVVTTNNSNWLQSILSWGKSILNKIQMSFGRNRHKLMGH